MTDGWPFWLMVMVLVIVHFVLRLTFGLGPAAPDLLGVAVLLGARQLSGGPAAGYGFGLGILQDAVSLAAFGAAAGTHAAIGYLGARSRDLFVGESLAFLVGYLFLGIWLRDVLYYVVAPAVRRGEAVEALLVQAPLNAAYAAAAGLAAILIFRALQR